MADPREWIQFEGGKGSGTKRHIVLVSGDEEYRSEETMPMLAKLLATHHGFDCTVLFAIDPGSGEIDPQWVEWGGIDHHLAEGVAETEEIDRLVGLVERLPELSPEEVRQLNVVVPEDRIVASDEDRVGIL